MSDFTIQLLICGGLLLLLIWTLVGGQGGMGARVHELWVQRAKLLLPFVCLYLVLLLVGHWVL